MPKSAKFSEKEVIFDYLASAVRGANAISLKANIIGSRIDVAVVRYDSDGRETVCEPTDELREAIRSHRGRYPLLDGGPWYTMRAEITDGQRLLTNSSEPIEASWEDMLIDFAEFPNSLSVAPGWLKEAWAKEGNTDGE